jgi:hypothetical protein
MLYWTTKQSVIHIAIFSIFFLATIPTLRVKILVSKSVKYHSVRQVSKSLVLCVDCVDHCLFFCPFSFGHCVVCSSSICGFWIPLCLMWPLYTGFRLRRGWRYQRGNQNPYIEEEQTTQWPTGLEPTTLVVIVTDCIGSCKSNYHTITTMTTPWNVSDSIALLVEDTKGVIRIRISKKNRQHNGQKKRDKRTNNDLQNTHIKLKLTLYEDTKGVKYHSVRQVSKSLVLCVDCVDHCLFFCPFSFGHCVGHWLHR